MSRTPRLVTMPNSAKCARIELIRLETPDLNGVSRGKTVTADHFWSCVAGGQALVSDIYCWDHECWVATGTGFGEDLTFALELVRIE